MLYISQSKAVENAAANSPVRVQKTTYVFAHNKDIDYYEISRRGVPKAFCFLL